MKKFLCNKKLLQLNRDKTVCKCENSIRVSVFNSFY